MNAHNHVGYRTYAIIIWLTIIVCCMDTVPLYAAASEPTSQTEQQERRQKIRTLVQEAKTLLKKEKYPDSLRMLYDALYEEKKYVLGGENVYDHIYSTVSELIHHDSSSLMRYLRNKNVPFQEKNSAFDELLALTKQADASQKARIHGKYTGPLVALLSSQRLYTKEKLEILSRVRRTVRKEYISEEQKKREWKRIIQKTDLYGQKMDEQQYAEAYRLLDECMKLENAVGIRTGVLYGHTEFLEFFASREASPMMLFLRDTTISLQQKQVLLDELESLARGEALAPEMQVAQEQFQGPLTELMIDTMLSLDQRMGLLSYVREVIEKEYSPIP